MLVLVPPVPGPIARPFVYAGLPFARGLHRGIDLRAAPGEVVRAPCSGVVAYAGAQGVTLVCAGERVTLLPIAPVVRARGRVSSGAAVGRVRGDAGLHLGVRHPDDPFGYVDPAPLLRRARPSPPPVAPRPRGPAPRGAPAPAPVRAPQAAPGRAPQAAPVRAPRAPWPAWAGLAVLLVGALGGVRWRVARGRGRAPRSLPLRT